MEGRIVVALGIFLLVAAVVALIFGILLADGEPEAILVVIVGLVVFVGGLFIVFDDGSPTAIQQAADKQGIEVVISDGGHDVTTKSPCTLRLDLQNGELVLDGTNNVITKDKLATICATLAK